MYLAHSSAYPDYHQELYEPIKDSELSKQYQFIFPHEKTAEPVNSKKLISGCDLILAEVSFSSTGMGIELGWADMFNRKIICVHKEGVVPSSSLKFIAKNRVSYRDGESLIKNISRAISGV